MKNVIFDLGGVVLDWSPERIMKEYSGDPELPVFLFKKGFFQASWQEFDRGLVTQQQLVVEMSDFSGHPYAECWDMVEFIKHSLWDIPDTVRLIKELSAQGYHLYCLSNMSEEFYDYLKDREYFTYFEGQIISALEHLIKPDEAIFRLLLDRYRLLPQETLYIDDLEVNIETARKLGFCTVHFVDKEKSCYSIREQLKG